MDPSEFYAFKVDKMSKANYFYWKRKKYLNFNDRGFYMSNIVSVHFLYISIYIISGSCSRNANHFSFIFEKSYTEYDPALLSCNTYKKSSSLDNLFSNINVILLELLKKYLCPITIGST